MVRFKMLARDVNSNPTQYRTWVDEYLDKGAVHYTGYKSGDNDFVDVESYLVNNPLAILDFNLPNETHWSTTKRVLPEAISESQLAIIDGYIYLFGGLETDKIFRADVNNPADWEDTGSTLPGKLYGSQLAVIDGYSYLFGGFINGIPTDEIYKSSVNDPLTWTNTGSGLLSRVGYSQLSILDGYIYLFGGMNDGYLPSMNVCRASVSDPLTWYDDGYELYEPLSNSQVAIIDGYVYLFGGRTTNGVQTAKIYHAQFNNLGTWTVAGSLPYPVSSAQYAIIGNDGYLFGTVNSGGGNPRFTSIMVSNVNTPGLCVNTGLEIPGEVSSSQLAIIYDRLFLFGGNGSSIIFASNPIYKYKFTDPKVIAYANRSRTIINNTIDDKDLFKNLGFAPWRTDYKK